jgi:hypothetical protein
MRTLLLRLSALDAEAEGAVRVIAVFDALVSQHVGMGRLARVTAQLAECPVGISVATGGVTLRCAPDGHRLLGDRPDSATCYPVDGGGEVWLERDGPPLALDDIVGERFAAAAEIVRGRQLSSGPRLGDPALVELAISHSAEAPERSRALHLMGLSPATRVRVLAVAGDVANSVAHCANLLGHAPIQDLHAALLVGGDPHGPTATPPTRVGVGPLVRADEAWRSWRGARLAVRFAADDAALSGGPWLHGGSVVRWDDLGGVTALAEHVPPASISEIPDVRALDRLAAARGGPLIVATLQAVCMTDSIRNAGTAMHLHHSSVAARLMRAEDELGFSVRTAAGRSRLALALTLRHLREHPA